MGGNTHTAVLFDRHPMWLEAVGTILVDADTHVVGKASDIETAIALVGDLKPDLFVTDMVGGEAGGVDVDHLQAAQRLAPGIKCIVLSSVSDESSIGAALSAGAAAYVLKSAHPDDLASAVRQVFEQSIFLIHSAAESRPLAAASFATATAELTKRERQILCLVAEGHSNAQLAKMLWVTEQTVKFHLSNVYRKIDAANRTEAGRWAHQHGLLSPDDDLRISA